MVYQLFLSIIQSLMQSRLATYEQKDKIRDCFQKQKKALKSIVKQFSYKPSLTHAENMTKLCACLQSVLQLDEIEEFCKYISDMDRLPIEVNFEVLRFENIEVIFQDWLNSQDQQSSLQLQNMITLNYRNLLLKRILIEEKQAINDYFSTLSQKKQLKGFDLYQLIQTLFSSYFLYEFNSDRVDFFQKTQSFQAFMGIAEDFIVNERRITQRDKSNPEDFKYIRRYEFEQLIEFWEARNLQLTFLHEPRKNHIDFGVQTTVINCSDQQTQMEKQKMAESSNYLSLINSTIHGINTLIETQNQPELLDSLNRVFDVLRKQKVLAVKLTSQLNFDDKKTLSHPSTSSPQVKENGSIIKILKPASEAPPNKSKSQIKLIFQHLTHLSDQRRLTINELQIFLYQIKLVKAHQNHVALNLLKHDFISNSQDISYEEFTNIINQLMIESNSVSHKILREYVDHFVHGENQKNMMMRMGNSPKTERSYHLKLLQKKNQTILSRSTFQLDSE